ncbi:Rgp1-domain-containing protein [Neolentinus lepideus HHB14362 ss-1]|uniref:Rgp1-domain-containing protein n=1 Tax=Neolentinus lepideus HHB14362 ss-1 TaxID=1314782 RepID=A0A165S4D5_9AGAM|nr:Rgp1-domain-containing protein [Neolentinus lepideus HHB14362 ss-1]
MSASDIPGPSSSADADTGIRVIVTPTQSAYFAGETFSVSITITNIRPVHAQWIPPRSLSHTHKRASHSVSSAPLARPPTSPGTPRTAVTPIPSLKPPNGNDKRPRRRGLVGKSSANGGDSLPGFLDQSRKRLLAKSLSVSLSPNELQERFGQPDSHLSSVPERSTSPSSSSAQPPNAIARTPTLSIAPNHPHARKNSVMNGQLQLHDLNQSPISPSPASPNASSSNFSLSLDTIAESSQSSSPSPQTVPPDPDLPSIVNTPRRREPPINGDHRRSRPPPLPVVGAQTYSGTPQKRSMLGLGNGAPSHSQSHLAVPRTAFSSTFPQSNHELILYSYAQLTGSLTIAPVAGLGPSTPDSARTLNMLRSTLLRRGAMGGGSMDITSSLDPRQYQRHARRRSHIRSASFSSGLLSMLSPSSLLSPTPTATSQTTPWSPAHRRTQTPSAMASTLSLPGLSSSGSGVGLGFGAMGEEEVDPEAPLPVLEVPPSMLAVDLTLGPGESRTYTYTMQLPDALPPTYRGRVLKLSYEFTVGICRAGRQGQTPSSPIGRSGTGGNSNSRVMKVPVRIYNYVSVHRPPCPYDLLWPVAKRKDVASLPQAKVTEESNEFLSTSRKSRMQGSLDSVREYALRLMASYPNLLSPEQGGHLTLGTLSPFHENPDREREPEGALTGCREAVEILTRNQKKVSYDVNKDGVQVAVLTFTKSAYRLGETVLGVVELNHPGSRGRVLKLSAMLEAHETLPAAIGMSGNARQLRRVHAEHHSSFIPSMLRTTFALDIPPDASPAFQVGLEDGSGGLEWKVRLCLLVAVASPGEGIKLKQLVRDGPRGEWAASWRASSSIAPMERLDPRNQNQTTTPMMSWASYFASFVGAAGEGTGYHDGDEDVEDVEGKDDQDRWQELKVETVECEVPIKVWPGNTAFKAMEVVFDV